MEPDEYDNIARLEDRHWWYLGMRAIAEAWVRIAVNPGVTGGRPTKLRLLDAGCGTGGGLRWLAGLGSVIGLDYSPLAVRHAGQVSSTVTQASIQAMPLAGSAFDGLTSFEVLYHLAVSDDAAALGEMLRVLRPGGWLLLRVPAHDWLRGAHDRQVHTRHRYGRDELRRKLRTAGFEIRRLSYVGLTLVGPAILRRLAERPTETHSDVSLPPPFANRLLTLLLRAEGRWLARRDLPAGLSLMALARKPTEGQ